LSTPEAVVFDLGNVLIRWDPHAAIAAGVGPEEATRFLEADDFDFRAWNHAQDAGRSWDEAVAEAVRSHPHWRQHVAAYRSHFAESIAHEVDDTVEVLRELHEAKVPLFALTNWSAELFPAARERYGFLQLFDDIVVSGEVRAAKPAPEVFDILRQRTGRALESCLFIDDSPDNVEGARRSGLQAVLFTDAAQLRDDLRARGLPLA
jgi:2-haloacid dehalogenase